MGAPEDGRDPVEVVVWGRGGDERFQRPDLPGVVGRRLAAPEAPEEVHQEDELERDEHQERQGREGAQILQLLLADEPGRPHSGAVLGTDIASRSLTRTNVVVIDEVEAANTDRGEGTLSLARAFIAAGVPAVLGTLAGADETATRDLMIAFHREMSKGVSPEEALSTVQRNALQKNGRRIGAWTALVLYGSDR